MTIKINKKIKAYTVAKPDDNAAATAALQVKTPAHSDTLDLPTAEVIQMHERVERPEVLIGSTYKIKSPLVEHALYVTINDIVLNQGTEYESRRPFEIFINSKNMDHFQWVVAITRIMSAVFRKGGDVTFLVEELKAVFDPRGGYFKAGGIYMPSIVAEIGAVVEDHLKQIGMIVGDELSDEQKRLIAEKRAAYDARAKKNSDVSAPAASPTAPAIPAAALTPSPATAGEGWGGGSTSASSSSASSPADTESAGSYPPGATMCSKCSTKASIIMDGCATCLSCGYSKCG
ncbi:NrdJb [Chiayiivirga flava]|uniref:ribonucleoside-diphosphate reductase n=1 Tax=Chiayiivirga flava TaxID=659595 RepID=A0A7W8DA88_9GAMM|nr:NrdJb [Chiayiivirga flava]MBB5209640.1 hypothetical protein [Chiayiivirga flava]